MKKNKRWLVLLIVTALIVELACVPSAYAKKKVSLSQKSVKVIKGKTKKVSVKKNGNRIQKVRWISKNKKIASVKKKGKLSAIIKGKKQGTTKLIAKVTLSNRKSKKLTCKIRVVRASEKKAEKKVSTTAPVKTTPPVTTTPVTTSPVTTSPVTTSPVTTPPVTTPPVTTPPVTTPPVTTPPVTTPPVTTPPVTTPPVTTPPVTTPPVTTSPVPTNCSVNVDGWKNSNVYTSAWKGNAYNLSAAVSGGITVSDYTKIEVTLNLYDTSGNLITEKNNGGVAIKVSTSSSDWGGFNVVYGVYTGTKTTISIENFPETATNLYMIVQNSTAEIGYIEVAEATFVYTKKKDSSDAVNNYESLYSLATDEGFKMGTVMNYDGLADKQFTALVAKHFNSITAANEMKAYSLLSQSASQSAYVNSSSMPVMNYTKADAIMDFAKENGIGVRGHALVWDASMCDWFFREGYTSDGAYVSEAIMDQRVEYYIDQVIRHFEDKYPGVIYCWDVVNEAVDTGNVLTQNDTRCIEDNIFSQRMGDHYVEKAFQYAYNTVNTLGADIELYYNDFSTFYSGKTGAIIQLVKSINQYVSDGKGGYLKLCDGVGMQSYIGGFGQQSGCMANGDIGLITTAINRFRQEADVDVQITELAVRNYDSSEEKVALHAAFYKKLMEAYVALNKDVTSGHKISSFSIWGLCDNPDLVETDYGYKMNGPYCGLFDEFYGVKQSFINVYNVLNGDN